MADDIVGQYYLANALRQGQRQSTRSVLAQRMMGNALDTSPTTPLGALARALTGVVSAYSMQNAEEGDRIDQKRALSTLMDRDQQQQQGVVDWQSSRPGAQQPAAPAAPADAGTPPGPPQQPQPAAPAPARPAMDVARLPEDDAAFQRSFQGRAPGATTAPPPASSDLVPRMLMAEARGQGPEGMAAVAHVIRNRAALTGRTPEEIVQQRGQFEPWGNPRTRAQMLAMPPDQFAPAADIWRRVSESQIPDPTGGATHFLNPDMVRQLGRPMPSWAPEGQGQRIGAHVFYARPEDFRRVQVAGPGAPTDAGAPTTAAAAGGGALPPSAAAATAPAAPAPASAAAPPVAAPASGGLSAADRAWIEQGLNHPNPRVQQAARNMLQVEQAFRQQDTVRTAAPGSAIIDRNGRVIGTVPQTPHLPAGWRIGANGQAEQIPGFTPQTSMVPVQGYDRDGNPTLLFPNGQGGLVQAQAPEGVSLAPRTREINTGTEMVTVDQGGRVVSRRPIDVAGREAQQEVGRAAGQQQAGAEQAAEVAQRTLGQIEAVLNHPAIGLGTGVSGIVARRVPGTAAYDFGSRVDQLGGQAFLQAFNTLRGGGAITEIEGRKATEAIARLDPRLGEEAFRSALGELREIVQTGLARARRQGGAAPAAGGAPAPGAGAATGPATHRWNPQTGQIEAVN